VEEPRPKKRGRKPRAYVEEAICKKRKKRANFG